MAMTQQALAKALVGQPRWPLAHLPTPIDLLPMPIAGHRVLIKRDDCTGFALGGNKSRKLEYTLGDARRAGATALLTASGIQSNHVRQSAAAAAVAGMAFHGIVAPALDHFSRAHLASGNVLVDQLYGAQLHLVEHEELAQARITEIAAQLTMNGEQPYIIPLGASDGVGSLGYVGCALELLDQLASIDINPTHIFLPTGSGGTHGGLLAGLRAVGSAIAVIGISVSEPAAAKRAKVRASIDGIEAVLGLGALGVVDADIIVNDSYTGAGYARPTEAANDWIVRVARQAGILLDPVYTGKAFAGMADLLERGARGEAGDIVFLHTGGTPALFADPYGIVGRDLEAKTFSALSSRIVD